MVINISPLCLLQNHDFALRIWNYRIDLKLKERIFVKIRHKELSVLFYLDSEKLDNRKQELVVQ
jgi:hypothetical protein